MAKKQPTKNSPVEDPDNSESKSVSFEESLAALETIVQQLETGKLPLFESLARYEEGVGCLKACYEQLASVERRIELLSGVDAEGNPITEPLADEGGGDLEEKARNRSRRRSSGPPSGPSNKAAKERIDSENDVDDGELLF